MKKQNPRLFRFGAFTVILTVVVFGIVILVNVLFQSLPSSVRVLDISEQQYSKLSDESIRLVKNLKEDVTVYVLRQNGTEPSSQDTRTVSMMVNHYDELSDHLTVRYIDPNEYPNLRNKYNISGTVYYYSVIVESASRARYVPFLCEYPQQGIFVEYVDYESYNSSNGTYDTERVFEGEKAITSAIDFVTKEKLPVMAQLTGHGESEVQETLLQAFTAENAEVRTLNLETAGAISDEIDVLLIFAPQKDLSERETETLLSWAEQGGKIFLVTAATETELPNLKKIVSRFSLEEIPRVVIETDSNYFSAYYGAYCLMPAMNNHQITESLIANGYRPWLPYSSAIKAVDKDESTVITPLLVTSEKAFLKSYDATTLEKEAGDEEGMFAVGVVSELKPAENGETPTLVWYASPYAMDLVEANITLATNTLDYLMGDEEGLSIPTRTITNSILMLSQQQATVWTIILAAVVPALVMAAGIVVVVRRSLRKGKKDESPKEEKQ